MDHVKDEKTFIITIEELREMTGLDKSWSIVYAGTTSSYGGRAYSSDNAVSVRFSRNVAR